MTTLNSPTDVTPAVWLGCLACYAEGVLNGRWVNAVDALDITPENLHHGRATTHEELWVFDHENIPVREEMDAATAAGWGNVLNQVEGEERPALIAWVESGDYIVDGDTDYPSLMFFRDAYQGHWVDFDEFARHLATDMGLLDDVPEHVARYFDWESWISDLRFDYREEPTPINMYGAFIFRTA